MPRDKWPHWPTPEPEHPVWTALYLHSHGVYYGCYNVELGDRHGKVPLKWSVAMRLARAYLKKLRKRKGYTTFQLVNVQPGTAAQNHY